MLSQKERVESEVLAWRRALHCNEENAVVEKAHGRDLLGQAVLPENNVNTHQFSSIITKKILIRESKKRSMHAFVFVISCCSYFLLKITSIPALKCEVQVRGLKQRKLQT